MDNPDQKSDHLTQTEVESAVRGLDSADLLRLTRVAALFADGTSQTGDDLFQEAVFKALDGQRKCPREVDFPVFLANAMRSLAWASRERETADPLSDAYNLADPEGPGPGLTVSDSSTEDELIARRDYKARQQALLDLFEDDEDALKVLMSLFEIESAEEIREIWGLSKTEFATIRRRIRRKIDRAFPGGWR